MYNRWQSVLFGLAPIVGEAGEPENTLTMSNRLASLARRTVATLAGQAVTEATIQGQRVSVDWQSLRRDLPDLLGSPSVQIRLKGGLLEKGQMAAGVNFGDEAYVLVPIATWSPFFPHYLGAKPIQERLARQLMHELAHLTQSGGWGYGRLNWLLLPLVPVAWLGIPTAVMTAALAVLGMVGWAWAGAPLAFYAGVTALYWFNPREQRARRISEHSWQRLLPYITVS